MTVNYLIYNSGNKTRIQNKYKISEKKETKEFKEKYQIFCKYMVCHLNFKMPNYFIRIYYFIRIIYNIWCSLGFQKHPNFKNKYEIVPIHLASRVHNYTLCPN